VLVDFWTYSCVNCNRALPYVEKWYQAYASKGLVIIGVHTPEFAFEHNPTNVANAVKADGITYPVALDNNYDTWNAFQNDAWPADYLIDKSGNIRYISLGEGSYNVTEEAIQTLLGIHQPLVTPVSSVPISTSQTDETYFGTNRASNFYGSPPLNDGSFYFAQVPLSKLPQNNWTLTGNWSISPESITSQSGSNTLSFRVEAKDVYMVAGSTNNQATAVSVGLPSYDAGQYAAGDKNGTITVSSPNLYHIVSLQKFGTSLITLTVPAGVSLYTFTFGS
jgi:thiol-disulfide isomerase/thioredoxin